MEPSPQIDYLECHRCSYSLRGLTLGDRCPECGTEARESYRLWPGRPPRGVLRRVSIGAALLAAGTISPALAVSLLILLRVSPLPILLAGLVLCTMGAWLISAFWGSRSAAHLGAERAVFRVLLVVLLIGAAGAVLGLRARISALLIISGVVVCIVGFIVWVAVFTALGTFAEFTLRAPGLALACRSSLLLMMLMLAMVPVLLGGTWPLAVIVLLGIPAYAAALMSILSWRTARLLRA